MSNSHRNSGSPGRTARRFLTPAELDKLWIWVCGSVLGGGFIRGTSSSIAKAFGIPVRTFERLMRGQSNFSIDTIENAINTIDFISKKEAGMGELLSGLHWHPESNTAIDEAGRYFARYLKNGSWAYLIGCGNGYRHLACAKLAAEKMATLYGMK